MKENKKNPELHYLCVLSHSVMLQLCDPMDFSPPGSSVHGDSPGKNTEMDCHFLLLGIYPTQGSAEVSLLAGRFFTI